MSALPHIGRTLPQRRDLRVLRGGAAYAEHQHYTDPGLRWEMERAARTELLPVEQPEPALFCAVDRDEDESPDLLGIVDAMRDEFGPNWFAWAALYIFLVAIGTVAAAAIVWSANA